MTRRKTPLTGKKATVFLERNGLSVRIDDVEASECAMVALDLLLAFRTLQRQHGELVPDLNPVGGYAALDTSADEWADDSRRAGFRTPRP